MADHGIRKQEQMSKYGINSTSIGVEGRAKVEAEAWAQGLTNAFDWCFVLECMRSSPSFRQWRSEYNRVGTCESDNM